MSSIAITWIAFGCTSGGMLLGLMVRAALPERDLSADQRDVVRQAVSVIATLVAVVLGLLVGSAKNSYDVQSSQINQMTANITLLDRLLAQYGPETKTSRELLRRSIDPLADQIWREGASGSSKVTRSDTNSSAEEMNYRIQELTPQSDTQRSLQAQAIQIGINLAQTRFLLFGQTANTIPMPFLVVLIFWLTIVFASFGFFARPDATVIAALFVCALAACSSIFLVVDLDRPFTGLMAISSAPLRNALAPLGS